MLSPGQKGSMGGGRNGFLAPVKGKRARRCPKCQAAPGHSCGRWDGMGVWRTQRTMHRER